MYHTFFKGISHNDDFHISLIPGYYVGGVTAYDLDGDNVNFFIQTGGEDKFDIGGTSGTITVSLENKMIQFRALLHTTYH